VLGPPTAEQRSEYRAIRDAYRSSVEQCRPGVTAGEVYAFVVEELGRIGRSYHSILAGHSVGCWWHQQEPVISRGNSIRLEEGMVIAMEPHIDHWHIQDMFVIEADGPRLLSDGFSTDEAFVIPA
jgi:Xaa-Pro aminopeptidase